jgi:hypothetical protein
MRESRLRSANVNFLVQAFRYLGKANYRDSIYLSYGDNRSEALSQLVNDLKTVANAFTRMAAIYVSRRVVAASWQSFSEDLTAHARFTLPFDFNG